MTAPVVAGTGPQSATAILQEDWSPQEFGGLPAPAPAESVVEPTPETPAAPVATETPAAPADDTAAEPAAAETKAEEKAAPPLTRFAVFDDQGEVELPPVQLEYKVDGKMVRNPIDKVVHLAQQATFNARQAQEYRQRVEETVGKSTALSEAIAKYEQYATRMLEDPEFYDKARAEWQEQQSPERRAQNAESELQALKQQKALQEELEQVSRYTADEILPSISSIADEFLGVTPDVLLGRLAMEMPRFQVNGRVPLHRLPEVRDFVNTSLRDYAAEFSGQVRQKLGLVEAQAAQQQKADAAAAQAQKRQLIRTAIQPSPSGSQAGAPRQEPVVKSAKDVFNDPLFGGTGS